jgi:hypothetical protein
MPLELLPHFLGCASRLTQPNLPEPLSERGSFRVHEFQVEMVDRFRKRATLEDERWSRARQIRVLPRTFFNASPAAKPGTPPAQFPSAHALR